eukprot:1014283-Amphidinium_carterae.1
MAWRNAELVSCRFPPPVTIDVSGSCRERLNALRLFTTSSACAMIPSMPPVDAVPEGLSTDAMETLILRFLVGGKFQ